eukprot:136146-Rhodomonas_salina.2
MVRAKVGARWHVESSSASPDGYCQRARSSSGWRVGSEFAHCATDRDSASEFFAIKIMIAAAEPELPQADRDCAA